MILEAAEKLRSKKVSSVELTQQCLDRIHQHDARLNCFISLTADAALLRARQADEEIARGEDKGPLHGIPIAHKDLFYTKGVRTTAGSKIYADFVPDHDAAVVEKLDQAGAVSLGKLNLHELAYGISSQNEHFGGVKNPWNTDCVPGGSSGGSGAGVAAGFFYCGTGTDTGGSIRIPASYCGVVGIKPTFGRVSRYGCFPLSNQLDHMGPLTKTVRDAAAVLNAMAGYDPRDPYSANLPPEDFAPPAGEISLKGLRIGLPLNSYFDRVEPGAAAGVEEMARIAESAGATIARVRVPDLLAMNAAAITALLAEAACTHAANWEHRRADIGALIQPLLELGRAVTGFDYVAAQERLHLFRREFAAVWNDCDVLFTPSTPIGAPRIDAPAIHWPDGSEEDPRLGTTRLIRAINFLRYPAMSQPCGFSPDRLPYGLQTIGPIGAEALVLKVGAALEDRTDFHRAHLPF